MRTLVIYDTKDVIYFQVQGDAQKPVGIPFLWLEIPEGKKLKSINTVVEPHEPVYEDIPKL